MLIHMLGLIVVIALMWTVLRSRISLGANIAATVVLIVGNGILIVIELTFGYLLLGATKMDLSVDFG
ncbi:hypothetical protein K469DRAFT_23487 [Zopfia rhizophila CBS 207.26]|uniref:Uncharacterized protein n=1 Tax=Zopfia rhizophila CBS 207.26 TaxID=1314779 RepID=A0A6A6EJM1_9PEZI|nr:hypothetical protein K469DRAFT_23487 [Zopfia rhizophila CBS 207.26]